ncbi:MAG: 2-amino-4-hydroxy-6-hydroxymethyldihydropteridine diphosphokinase [Candidatus Margulisbacteria bacterium]|nr:2-amino-4-hydroxy-6-hydroxymethyldihydropteridine diphosphokinase [Candidatus Margulisiibacteriota bacterium]
MMNNIYIGLGSNIGDRTHFINEAIDLLSKHDSITVLKISKFYETKPENNRPAPDYINAALEIECGLNPKELLRETQNIERELGRTSKGTYEPRTIDIDILFYGVDIVCVEGLTIPHPFVHERSFVLKPLVDIASRFVHPVLEKDVQTLYDCIVGY